MELRSKSARLRQSARPSLSLSKHKQAKADAIGSDKEPCKELSESTDVVRESESGDENQSDIRYGTCYADCCLYLCTGANRSQFSSPALPTHPRRQLRRSVMPPILTQASQGSQNL